MYIRILQLLGISFLITGAVFPVRDLPDYYPLFGWLFCFCFYCTASSINFIKAAQKHNSERERATRNIDETFMRDDIPFSPRALWLSIPGMSLYYAFFTIVGGTLALGGLLLLRFIGKTEEMRKIEDSCKFVIIMIKKSSII